MNKLRVAIISETFRPEVNGVANTLSYWVDGLIERNIYVQVIRPRQTNEDKSSRNNFEEHVTVAGFPIPGYPELKFGLATPRLFRSLWRSQRPVAVYIATEGPLGWSAKQAAKALNIPLFSGFHTNFQSYSSFYGFGWLQNLIMAYLKRFHNATDTTFVPTKTQADYLRNEGFERIKVLSRGVDGSRFNPDKRCPKLRASWGVQDDDHPVFIYVGRLAHEKNVLRITDAYASLKQYLAKQQTSLPTPKLVFVGDGPAKADLVFRCPDAIFAGVKRGQELSHYYASADIFLFPSKTDTFGNVVTEAMASRLAVVAFDDAAAKEHLEHEESALLCQLDDDDGFDRNMLRLATNHALVAKLRQAAFRAARVLSWSAINADFYQKLVIENTPFCPSSSCGFQQSKRMHQRREQGH